MSEKSTAVKVADVEPVIEKTEKDFLKTVQDAKNVIRKALGEHQARTSRSTKAMPKISTSSKSEDPKATKVCQMSKMSKISTSNKPKVSEVTEIGQMSKIMSEIPSAIELEIFKMPKECQKDTSKVPEEILKTTSETSTSIELETSKVPKVRQMSQNTPEMSTSAELEARKVPEEILETTSETSTSIELETSKVPKVCQMSQTTSEMSTSAELEARKVPEEILETTSETSTSIELETSKVPKVCQISKTTSEMSTSAELEARKVPEEILETTSETSTSIELETSKVPKVCQISKTMSEMSTSAELEARKVPEEILETTSETSTSIELETSKVPKVDQMSKTVFEISISAELEGCKIPEVCQVSQVTFEKSTSANLEISEVSDISEVCQIVKNMSKITICSEDYKEDYKDEEEDDCEMPALMDNKSFIFQIPIIPEDRQMIRPMFEKSTSTKCDDDPECSIPDVCEMTKSKTSTSNKIEEPEVRRTRSMSKISTSDKTEKPEVPEVRRTCSTTSQIPVPIKSDDFEVIEAHQANSTTSKTSTFTESEDKTNSAKNIKDDDSEIPEFEEMPSLEEIKSPDDISKKIRSILEEIPPLEEIKSSGNISREKRPILEENEKPTRNQTRKIWLPLSNPNFTKPHLVLASHQMVPSLPIELFEVLAEIIEVVTERPVVLLHESRVNRLIATDIVDIAVLPMTESWQDGVLLPASFVFEHHLNKTKSPGVYVEIIVTDDRASHIKNVMDLRGYRCVIPNQRKQFTATGLLFNHLQLKGENMTFFGNIDSVNTQLDVLEMVASKQAEAGVLESPVIRCNKHLPGIESLQILTTLGPLPPYRIMVKKALADELNEKLTTYLLNLNKSKEWMERLMPFGVIGFAENSMDNYSQAEKKKLITNVPYY